MIKYLELTAPESNDFRQAKILSIEINEGDDVDVGDTLFRVKSGESEINLPATKAGKVTEMIASVGENISSMTPLLLLETEVKKEPEKPPKKTKTLNKKTTKKKVSKKSRKKVKKGPSKQDAQQSLNLSDTDVSETDPDTDNPAEQNNSKPSQTTMNNIQITVPDIGIDSAKVIELLVKVGDSISIDDSLITLESDKASMDVPSTHSGIVSSIAVQTEQDVSEGDVILELSSSDETVSTSEDSAQETSSNKETSSNNTESKQQAEPSPQPDTAEQSNIIDIKIPDIGGDSANVIEILVKAGDQVKLEDPLVTLESDKASMDVPSPAAGTIVSIEVEIDQEISEGLLIAKLQTSSAAASAPVADTSSKPATAQTTTVATKPAPAQPSVKPDSTKPVSKSHASPSIRRFARELGVDLSKVQGTGRKSRITSNDVKSFVKDAMTKPSTTQRASSGAGIPTIPAVDFTRFGEIEVQPLNKIKRLTAANLHRSWLNVPHVTHNDEANINDLESFRKQLNKEYAAQQKDIKLSPLAFIVKAVVNGLLAYPQFNSSLDANGENLIYKKYFHIGIAVETPNGLVVPVIRDADKKSVTEIATLMGELALKARNKRLTPADMSGACFTISSLGGIGGTDFSPIVNSPEVAILGVSRSKMQPIWDGEEFQPCMMLPLSLSYDHRVIDGAEAARFCRHIASVLEDVRRLTV